MFVVVHRDDKVVSAQAFEVGLFAQPKFDFFDREDIGRCREIPVATRDAADDCRLVVEFVRFHRVGEQVIVAWRVCPFVCVRCLPVSVYVEGFFCPRHNRFPGSRVIVDRGCGVLYLVLGPVDVILFRMAHDLGITVVV